MCKTGAVLLLVIVTAAFAAPGCVPISDFDLQNLLSFTPLCSDYLAALAPAQQVYLSARPTDPTYPLLFQAYNGSGLLMRAMGHVATWSNVSLPSRDSLHSWYRLVCAQLYRPCSQTSLGLLPQAPPQSYCTDWQASVSSPAQIATMADYLTYTYAAQQLMFIFNASCGDVESGSPLQGSSLEVVGQPRFPPDNGGVLWTFNSSASVTVPAQSTFPVQSANFTCYWPMGAASSSYYYYCGPLCPLPIFTDDEYSTMSTTLAIFSWIGYFATLFVLITQLLVPRYRSYPANLVPFAVFGSHVIAFGFLFASTYGWRDLVCKDRTTFREGNNDSNDGACIFNGLTIIFGALITPCYWAAIAINSFIAISLQMDHFFRYRLSQPITHLICWAIPIGCCVWAWAAGRLGGVYLSTFCFVIDVEPVSGHASAFSYQWPVFFIPMIIALIIGLVCIAAVMWEMRHLEEKAGEFRYSKHIRLGAYLLVFWFLYAYTLFYRSWATAEAFSWEDNTQDWYHCAAIQQNCPRPSGLPPIWLTFSWNCVTAIQGIAISLLFGTSVEIWDFWRQRIENIREGRSPFEGVWTGFSLNESQRGVSSIRGGMQAGSAQAGVFSSGAGATNSGQP